jgi:hypothetical protein
MPDIDLKDPGARMAHARAAKDPYADIKAAQKRAWKSIDIVITKAAAKGQFMADDKEPPFDPNPEELPEGYVRVRCRKRGAGKISMGVTLHTQTNKFPCFQEGHVFALPRELAVKYGEGPNGDDGLDWVEPV